jgi:PEGA domain
MSKEPGEGAPVTLGDDPLAMFASDDERPSALTRPRSRKPTPAPAPSPAPPAASRRGRKGVSFVMVVSALVVGGLGVTAYRWWESGQGGPLPAPSAQQDGRLTVESRPSAAQVEIDGVVRGATPLRLRLASGGHVLRVGGATSREIPVVVTAGTETVHHVDLADVRTRLRVETLPPGATVTVDGLVRGIAPLDLDGLSAGAHAVAVEAGGLTVRRDVDVRPATASSIVITLGSGGGPVTGWLKVATPIDLEVYEGTRLVGRSRDGRLLLLAGVHDLTLVNRDLGFQTTSRLSVAPGSTARVRVEPGTGRLAVTAVPSAEVWLDGRRIGATPIANFPAVIGTHELLLRHPDFGEQRRTVIVTLTAPTLVDVTFRQ